MRSMVPKLRGTGLRMLALAAGLCAAPWVAGGGRHARKVWPCALAIGLAVGMLAAITGCGGEESLRGDSAAHDIDVSWPDGRPDRSVADQSTELDGHADALVDAPADQPTPDVGQHDGLVDAPAADRSMPDIGQPDTLRDAPAPDQSPKDERPNIVVIMTDDQEDGPSIAVMKHLKRHLIDQGITFENSFVDNALCCPSRATFLLGQCSHNTGVFMIGDIEFNGKTVTGGWARFWKKRQHNIGKRLQAAGYRTAMIGKPPNGYGWQQLVAGTPAGHEIPGGWNRWFVTVGLRSNPRPHVYPQYYNYQVNDDRVIRTYADRPQDYSTDVYASKAVEFISAQKDSNKPFLVYLSFFAPHAATKTLNNGTNIITGAIPAPRHKGTFANAPMPRPPSFNEPHVGDKPVFMRDATNPLMTAADIKEVEQAYRDNLESLLAVDEAVDDVVNALRAAGKLDNTVIIFTSDNGFMYGQHRREIGKRLAYEESIRVPLIMRGPGIPKNQARSHLVGNVDLAATVIDMAGATATHPLDGRSLIPISRNPKTAWRTALLLQAGDKLQFYPIRLDTRLHAIYQGVRTKSYTYVEHTLNKAIYPAGPAVETELYDLSRDPYQRGSKHADSRYSAIKADLRAKLNALRGCKGAGCWMTRPEIAPQTVMSPAPEVQQ